MTNQNYTPLLRQYVQLSQHKSNIDKKVKYIENEIDYELGKKSFFSRNFNHFFGFVFLMPMSIGFTIAICISLFYYNGVKPVGIFFGGALLLGCCFLAISLLFKLENDKDLLNRCSRQEFIITSMCVLPFWNMFFAFSSIIMFIYNKRKKSSRMKGSLDFKMRLLNKERSQLNKVNIEIKNVMESIFECRQSLLFLYRTDFHQEPALLFLKKKVIHNLIKKEEKRELKEVNTIAEEFEEEEMEATVA